MIFCGQCGLHLTPGMTVCPRCGTRIESEPVKQNPYDTDSMYEDEPTAASQSTYAPDWSRPNYFDPGASAASSQQPPLILSSDGARYYADGQVIDEPTHAMHTPEPALHPDMWTGYPDSLPPPVNNYPLENSIYPDYGAQGDYGYQQAPGQYEILPEQRPRRRGRNAVLLLLLIVLLALLGVVGFFILKLNNTPPPSQPSPIQQAEAVITQYYNDVNNQNYRDAYNLWTSGPLPYDQFVQGYANTQHDDITIDNTTLQSDNTVKVGITIKATEKQTSGSIVSVYRGSYILGQQNGIWKIISGHLDKVG